MCRHRCRLILIVAVCLLLPTSTFATEYVVDEPLSYPTNPIAQIEGRALFNPRIEYDNEWRPVGHSDPLKNDPTFDYSPPVLERVRYWSDPSNSDSTGSTGNAVSTGQINNNMKEKKEILLLGVPSKHTIYSHAEQKSSNRRMFYAPQPSRMLTPPPMHHTLQMGFQSDFGALNSVHSLNYWNQEPSIPVDAYASESASYLTVLKPKSSPNPYLATAPSVYKDASHSIYNFAANVNSLEASDKKRPWLQNLLQKEVTYQAAPTTPQIVMAYSPPIFESHSTLANDLHQYYVNPIEATTYMPATTVSPITLTTDEIFSHYKQPIEPLHGPMYLIIQGHSKVKTYGGQQTMNETTKHSPKMVPIEAVKHPVVKHVVSEDNHGNVMKIAHTHKSPQTNEAKEPTLADKMKSNSTVDSLLSLLDSSFMGFFLNDDQSKSLANNKTSKSAEYNKNGKQDAKHMTRKSTAATISTTPSAATNLSNSDTTSFIRDIS